VPTDNPFSLDTATESASETSRRKRLDLYGLQGLAKYANDPAQSASDLQEQPLYGGELSKSPSVSAEAGEPSQLATERVERAPMSQEASPLLAPEERLGNVLTGEEGSYGPLTGEQRSVSLKDFFGPARGGQGGGAADGGGVSRDVGSAEGGDDQSAGPPAGLKELGYAKQGLSAASMLDKNTGSNFDKYLRSLFTSGGQYTPGPTLGPNNFLGGAEGPSSYGDVFAPEAFTPSGPSMGPNTYLGAAEGPSSYGDVFDPGGVSSTGDTGAGAGGTGSYLSGGASLLGLIASIYGLSSGAEVTPQMVLNLLQSGITTASQLASLAASAGVTGASSAASGLAGVAGAAALPLGAAAAAMSVKQGVDQISTGEDRSIYNGISQLIGGPGAGYLSSLITQNMPLQPDLKHRQGAMEVSTDAVNNYQWGLQKAFSNGDLSQIQQLLGQGTGGISGAGLKLPDDVAKAIGIPSDSDIQSLTPEQFVKVLKAYSEQQPAGAGDGWFTATANEPYLGGSALLATTNAIRSTAFQAFNSLVQSLAPQLAQMPPVAPPSPEAMQSWSRYGEEKQAAQDQQAQEFNTTYQAQLRDLFNQNQSGSQE